MTIIAGSLATAADVNAAVAAKVSAAGGDASAVTVLSTGGITSRTLANRAADGVNVKDFGAAMDGVTFDTTAFNNARIAAGDHSIISVPAGGFKVNSAPTGGSAGPALWKLSGNCFTTGSTPVAGLGTDTVESFVAGSRYVGRQNSVADMGPVFRVDSTLNHSGGTGGFVMAGIKVNTSIPSNASALNNYGWGIVSNLTSAATGPGNHVALAAFATRTANGTEIWGANIGATDTTGNASSVSGALVTTEFDISADGLDDAGAGVGTIPAFQGTRVLLDLATVRQGASGAPAIAHFGYGVRVGGAFGDQSATQVERVFAACGLVGKAAFTTDLAVMASGADAFRMASGQTFALDASSATTLSSDGAIITATGKLKATAGLSAFGVTPPSSRPAITGSRGSATATVLASLLTALAATGIITDSTTA